MSRFARRLGFPALSLVCVITLGWPHAVRTSLYRSLYPLAAADQVLLASSPEQLAPLGYTVDDPADLAMFRSIAAPAAAGISDDRVRLRRLADLIYSYHPGSETRPIILGGRERGIQAILADMQAGQFALCGQKTMVLAAFWRSLGGDVRQIRFAAGEDSAWYAAHYGIEVYSPRWSKWFYYDATLNGYAEGAGGQPLSLVEINEHLASGEDVTMVANTRSFDWNADEFLEALRANPFQVYSLDNRLRAQDPDRRFGVLNFSYPVLSKLPKPLDRMVDAVTGDSGRRLVARPATPPPSSAARMHVSASQFAEAPSQ
jgi:hypothetical protein